MIYPLDFFRWQTHVWAEHVMNLTAIQLDEKSLPHRWYFVGDGVTVWSESDGHSPVEPKGPNCPVPGD